MCFVIAHHALAYDWYNFSMAAIVDLKWLVLSALCMVDPSRQANLAVFCVFFVKGIFHSDLEFRRLAAWDTQDSVTTILPLHDKRTQLKSWHSKITNNKVVHSTHRLVQGGQLSGYFFFYVIRWDFALCLHP